MPVGRNAGNTKFDYKTSVLLKYYVYMLINPATSLPFYIGKGTGNRVFDHVACALGTALSSDKLDTIREINAAGGKVNHVVVRHGMTERTAYEVESALIDVFTWQEKVLSNKIGGHHAVEFGVMTANEIIRKYNAVPLHEMQNNAVIININKTYKRGLGMDSVYNATKESWVIAKSRIDSKSLKYVLSEYKGLIVEVYRVADWYPVVSVNRSGKPTTRWGFDGSVAEDEVRGRYINRSVAHLKKQGSSNPIRLNL